MRKITPRKITSPLDTISKIDNNITVRPTIGRDKHIAEYYYIKIDNILPYKKQCRKQYKDEELASLAETIKDYGVMQPLTVIKSSQSGFYEVVSGERRLRASKIAGLEKVPCIILKEDNNAPEVAIIENIHRSDLHPIELAEAYNVVLDHGKEKGEFQSLASLSKKIGVSKSHFSEILSYNKLPEQIKEKLLIQNKKGRAFLRRLSKCSNEKEMISLLEPKKIQPLLRRKKLISILYSGDKEFVKFEKAMFTESERKIAIKALNDALKKLEN